MKTRLLPVVPALLAFMASVSLHAQASDRPDGMRFVPDVPGQFFSLTELPEPLGFHVGGSPDPSTCRHYQAATRVDGADGTPFFLVTRSGNTPFPPGELGCDDSDGETRNGHLIVFRMGSRDTNGERLRGNRLQRAVHIDDTPPPLADKASIYFTVVENGLVPFDGSGAVPPRGYQHPGGMQLVGHILGIALEAPRQVGPQSACGVCTSSSGANTAACDLCYNYDKAPNRTLIAFYDVSDPEAPVFRSNFVPRNGSGEILANAGALGITPLANGHYLMVVAGGPGTTFFFYRSTLTDLGNPALDWVLVDAAEGPEVEDPHQTLHFLREGDINGQLYLAGARGIIFFDDRDRLDLYRVDCDTPAECGPSEEINLTVRYNGRRITPYPPTWGHDKLSNLAAASGFHVTPSGELLFYATEHDNDGPAGSVKAGEWRHRDVVREDSPTLLPTAVVHAPDIVDEGGSVVLSGSGAPPITRPWIQFFHEPDFDFLNWIVDYDDYDRDDFDNFAALEPLSLPTIAHQDKASSLKWFAPVGCSIRVIDYVGVGNVDEARTLQGTGAIVRNTNLAAVLNDGGTDDIDEELDAVEFLDNCNDYYTSPFALSWDLDRDGTYESPGDSIAFSAAGLDGPSTVEVGAQAQHAFGGPVGLAATTITVRNVAPEITGLAVTNGAGQAVNTVVPFVLTGLPVAVGAVFVDPGLPDRQTAEIRWGDGSADQQAAFTAFNDAFGDGTGSLSHFHRYATSGQFTLRVFVTDDDAGADTGSMPVRVVTPEQAVAEIIALLDAAIAATAPGKTRNALELARKALAGSTANSSNGALAKIRASDTRAALDALQTAIRSLAVAGANGADVGTLIALLQQVAASLTAA